MKKAYGQTLRSLRRIYCILSLKLKVKAWMLIALAFVTSALDVIGVASIMPFLALINDPELMVNNSVINFIYEWTNIQEAKSFIIFIGTTLALAIMIIASIKTVALYYTTKFNLDCEAELSSKLLQKQITEINAINASKSNSEISKEVLNESADIVHFLIAPTLNITAQIFTIMTILVIILRFNPNFSILMIAIIATIIAVLKLSTGKNLKKLGEMKSKANTRRYRTVSDAAGAREEIYIRNISEKFYRKFQKIAEEFANLQSKILVLQQAPKFMIESLSFTGILIFVLIAYGSNTNEQIFSQITLFAVAAYKLMPALQQTSEAMSRISSSIHISENFTKQLYRESDLIVKRESGKNLPKLSNLEFRNINYRPNATSDYILKNVNISFKAGRKVGIVGESGSGKSTLIKIIMGLVQPTSGQIFLNGKEITTKSENWRSKITYLPQKTSIIEGNFIDNILFNLSIKSEVSPEVENAADLSQLTELILKRHDGYEEEIMEGGVNLSGGELQRLGIARAIYHSSEVVVLDEFTSALDAKTEANIVKKIHECFHDKLVIIISHRSAALENCDMIYNISEGAVKRINHRV